MKKIIVASANNYIFKFLKKNIKYTKVVERKKISFNYLKKKKPDIIFFPHWSWVIEKKIYENFNCIGFHSSPLPYGRGGTPIQNMIQRGHKSTNICAIKIQKGIDAGPIYMVKKISLYGSGDEILLRINKKISLMIIKIIKKIPKPIKQKGKIYNFKRRNPEMSKIKGIKEISKLYDHIRMLDVNINDFPKSFISNKYFKFEFDKVSLKGKKIIGRVKIKKLVV